MRQRCSGIHGYNLDSYCSSSRVLAWRFACWGNMATSFLSYVLSANQVQMKISKTLVQQQYSNEQPSSNPSYFFLHSTVVQMWEHAKRRFHLLRNSTNLFPTVQENQDWTVHLPTVQSRQIGLSFMTTLHQMIEMTGASYNSNKTFRALYRDWKVDGRSIQPFIQEPENIFNLENLFEPLQQCF